MDRPKFYDYWSHGLVTHDSDYKDYIDEMEKYCDYLENALDKACHKLWVAEGMMFKEHSKTQEQWKEWLLNNE